MPRKLFTDGLNSFWHFFLGLIAIQDHIIIPIFILYQLFDYTDVNLFIDIYEFLIGLMIGASIVYGFSMKIK